MVMPIHPDFEIAEDIGDSLVKTGNEDCWQMPMPSRKTQTQTTTATKVVLRYPFQGALVLLRQPLHCGALAVNSSQPPSHNGGWDRGCSPRIRLWGPSQSLKDECTD